ncbi:hypothetical protein BHUM_06224c [Candidatus Burkholderia humilis]|nr:hypothetical protein BHUM_06224c [Candidatus Burkholderia humilis]
MKATIISHEHVPDAAAAEIHRFRFLLDDGNASPFVENISLRTARVIVENLPDGSAFIRMLRAIVAALPHEYDQLVGREYSDERHA